MVFEQILKVENCTILLVMERNEFQRKNKVFPYAIEWLWHIHATPNFQRIYWTWKKKTFLLNRQPMNNWIHIQQSLHPKRDWMRHKTFQTEIYWFSFEINLISCVTQLKQLSIAQFGTVYMSSFNWENIGPCQIFRL